ncbi:MAG: RagB/SusD family nutrient uptake outer membrane protein [Mangrovibacterium sp.]
MKKKIYIALTLIGGLSLTSCKDFLDAPAQSTMDESVIFSSYDLASGAVDGIKISFAETNAHRGRFIPYYGMNTDAEILSGIETDDDKSDLTCYSATPDNSQMNRNNEAWTKMYEGIERANMSIQGLRTYADLSDYKMAHLLGEALTLRAIYYHDLLKAWGDVVYRFEPISSETTYLPRTDRDEVYKQLLADLGEASELVAWPNGDDLTTSTENVNKAYVKGLRAKLALMACGYGQRLGDSDYLSQTDDEDLSEDKMMALVKEECLSIINSGTCSLLDYETIFRRNMEDNISAGGESLWEIPFADGRGRVNFTFAVRHRGIDQYTAQARGGSAFIAPTLYYDFAAGDTRRDITCVPYEWGNPIDGFAQQQLTNVRAWNMGKYRYEWMSRYVTSTNDDGVNKIYMRYAEVVLMAAEAVNYIDGAAAAKIYLRMIRERAFDTDHRAEGVDDYLNNISSKEDMLAAIQEEHKFEFAGECIRKEALIRWGLLGDKLKETQARMTALIGQTSGTYGTVAFDYSNVPSKVYFKIADDGESLQYYGLERGETADMSSIYEENATWIPTDETSQSYTTFLEIRDNLYRNDPDAYQYWPLWRELLESSNGQLENYEFYQAFFN